MFFMGMFYMIQTLIHLVQIGYVLNKDRFCKEMNFNSVVFLIVLLSRNCTPCILATSWADMLTSEVDDQQHGLSAHSQSRPIAHLGVDGPNW